MAAVNDVGPSKFSKPSVPPYTSGILEFGSSASSWTHFYSGHDSEDVGTTKLTGIRYKQKDDVHELSGMQMIFSNTGISPYFESRDSGNETSKNIVIGQYERIAEVRVEVLDNDKLLGL